jgi:hypothetical protein
MRSKPAIVASLVGVVLLLQDHGLARRPSGAGPAQEGAAAVIATRGPDWTTEIAPDATIVIKHRGAPIVQSRHMFFQDNKGWTWADHRIRAEPRPGGHYTFAGQIPDLGIAVSGAIESPAPNVTVFDYRFQAARDLSSLECGFVQWKLDLVSPSFDGRLPDPVLLEDSTGWAWPVAGDQSLTVRADSPLAKVYFEKGQKAEIRTCLYGERVPAGTWRVRLTITLPEGARRELAAAERYGGLDTRGWFRHALAWDASPVDLRFLNRGDRPAGRRGFVRVDGDRFIFADGTPARFWGANVGMNAFLAPREEVPRQARRMAQLGYNLMRLVHHDTGDVIFGARAADTRHLDPKAVDALDWWIKCLKDEGIYIFIDMYTYRSLRPGDGVSLGTAEVMRHHGLFTGFCYYNAQLQDLMKEFQGSYLNHLNPYTNLRYKDDPAVMGVAISNENDLTHHFGNLMLPAHNNPVHNAIFTREYRAFAGEHGLPEARVFQTWLPGPSKLYLNEAEHRFNRMMIADLRRLGVKVPIVTTNFYGNNSLYGLPALADSDVIDVHSYGDPEALSTPPRYVGNYIAWIGMGQVHGKPLAVTEWNVPFPAVDRFTAPLYVASIAALQGWDAPMLFTYLSDALVPPHAVTTWSTSYDPAICGVMPAAALAYRRGHVSPARTTYCLTPGAADFFGRAINPNTSATIRTLTEQSRLTIGLPAVKELPWVKPTQPQDATVITDPDRDFIPAGQSFVRSDTGELTRDWGSGIQTIDTARTQAVSGWIGGRTLRTRDVTFQFRTPKAVVALSSVDDRPLASSRFLLITAVARAVGSPGGRTPILSEPVIGTLSLRSSTEDLQLLALGPDGRVVGRSQPSRAGESLTVSIPAARGTHWFVLKAGGPAREAPPARSGDGG